jgi:putative transcription factor
MQCEICGKDTNLVSAIVEGVRMNVCTDCARFGKILKEPVRPAPEKSKKAAVKEETVEIIVPDFARKIRKAREKLGLDQEKFGQKIGLKESVIHKIETGILKPSIDVARKLEKMLNINLVIEYKEEKKDYKPEESGSMTLGDIMKKAS